MGLGKQGLVGCFFVKPAWAFIEFVCGGATMEAVNGRGSLGSVGVVFIIIRVRYEDVFLPHFGGYETDVRAGGRKGGARTVRAYPIETGLGSVVELSDRNEFGAGFEFIIEDANNDCVDGVS